MAADNVSEISHKAETYVHYTYVKSQQQLMVTDIQGVDYTLHYTQQHWRNVCGS